MAELNALFQQFIDSDKALTRVLAHRLQIVGPASSASGPPGCGIATAGRFARRSRLCSPCCSSLRQSRDGLSRADRRRQRDLSVCLALSASRSRLARQLLSESLLISFAGGALGLVVSALWGAELLVGFLPDPGVDRPALRVTPDAAVLLFPPLAGGHSPARPSAPRPPCWPAAPDLRDALAAGGRTRLSSPGRTFRALVGVQVALSTTLVIAALLVRRRSLSRLMAEPPGFVVDGVLMLSLDAGGAAVPTSSGSLLQRQSSQRLPPLPGVRHAHVRHDSAAQRQRGRQADRDPRPSPSRRQTRARSQANTVAPEFFETFGVPILRGPRHHAPRDDRATPQVAVVSESMARFYFPGRRPHRPADGRGAEAGRADS